MGNYAAAEESLARAQAVLYETGTRGEDPTILNYRGFLLLNQGRLADAVATQRQALAGLTTQSYAQWRVKALTALAWLSLYMEQPDQAHDYLETAIPQCREINEQRQLAYALICRGTLRTQRGEWAAARPDFAEARTILRSFEMFNRALEAEGGLAYLAFLEGNATGALQGAHAILAHLEAHPVDFTEDVCQLLLSCYRILKSLDPAAATRLGNLARHHLDTRTATLDAATLKLFWQIPAHHELREACFLLSASVSPA
jgi:tetratricopeptide (TPR) repeat protein